MLSKINWKETVSVNKYAFIFMNVMIYLILAYAIYSFVSKSQFQEELLKGQRQASEERRQAIDESRQMQEQLNRIEKNQKRNK